MQKDITISVPVVGKKTEKQKTYTQHWSERLRPLLVFLASTVLSFISVYQLAHENIVAIANNQQILLNAFVVFLMLGLGIVVDATIVIAATRIQMHVQRGWKEAQWLIPSVLMFLFLITTESILSILFFAQFEASNTLIAHIARQLTDIVSILRPIIFVLTPAYLAVFVKQLVYERSDRKMQLRADTSVRLMALESDLSQPMPDGVNIEQERQRRFDLIALYKMQLNMYHYATDATVPEQTQDEELIKQFKSAITPEKDERYDTLSKSYETRIDSLIKQYEERLTGLSRQIDQLNLENSTTIAQIKNEAMAGITSMLLTGNLPPFLIDTYPELDGLSLSRSAIRPRKGIGNTNTFSESMRDKSDDLRELYLQVFDEDPPSMIRKAKGQPETKARGIWVTTSQIQQICGGQLSENDAKNIVATIGKGSMIGTSYGAPLREVLKDMRIRTLAVDPWKSWLERTIQDRTSEIEAPQT